MRWEGACDVSQRVEIKKPCFDGFLDTVHEVRWAQDVPPSKAGSGVAPLLIDIEPSAGRRHKPLNPELYP